MKNNIDLERIANLSALFLDDRERDELMAETQRLIDFASAIACDVEQTNAIRLEPQKIQGNGVTREDISQSGIERQTLLEGAPSRSADGYIKVPAVMRADGRRDGE